MVFILLLSLNGCGDSGPESVPSQGVTTESLSADMHVSSTGGEVVTVEAAIRQGAVSNGYFVDLSTGDSLRASSIGDPADIRFDGDLFGKTARLPDWIKSLEKGTRNVFVHHQDGIWYFTTFSGTAEDTEFTISLLRNDQNDAPRTTVKLPPAYAITEPAAGQVFSRNSDPITVTWSPGDSGYVMRLKGFVSCQNNASGEWSSSEIVDTGGYVIGAGTFNGYSGSCSIVIGVERFRHGQLDPAFGCGGKIEAHQYRTIMINSLD